MSDILEKISEEATFKQLFVAIWWKLFNDKKSTNNNIMISFSSEIMRIIMLMVIIKTFESYLPVSELSKSLMQELILFYSTISYNNYRQDKPLGNKIWATY